MWAADRLLGPGHRLSAPGTMLTAVTYVTSGPTTSGS